MAQPLGRGAHRGVIAGVIVAIYGVDFFPAYVSDLLSVTRSDTRAAPGAPLMEVINGPRFMIGSLALILSVIVLRQAGQDRAGLVLFLLAPGFVYVTYQNFGNDPKWLMLLAIYLLALRPESGRRVVFNADARNAVAGLALVSFALITPSFQNIVTSPFRHLATKAMDYAPQFKTRPELRDVFVKTQRTATVLGRVVMVDDLPQLAPYVVEDGLFKPVTFLGETLPRCTLQSGDVAMHSYMADRLKQPPFNFPRTASFLSRILPRAFGFWAGLSHLKVGRLGTIRARRGLKMPMPSSYRPVRWIPKLNAMLWQPLRPRGWCCVRLCVTIRCWSIRL